MSVLLTITYTPQVEVCHRIYFKNGGDTYCLYVDSSESVIGQSKDVTIDLDDYSGCINPLPKQISCNSNPDLVGYIQPCCVEEGSSEEIVEFTVEYPNAICTPYSVECQQLGCKILSITKTGDDILYDETAPFYPPIVTITSSCGGTGATAYVGLASAGGGGAIISFIVMDNFGEGYCNPECITVSITANGDGDSQTAEVSLVTPSTDCGNFRKRDCIGNPEITNYAIAAGSSAVICSGSPGPINVGNSTYTFTEVTDETTSCCECVKYEVINTNTEGSYFVNYTDCTDQTIKSFNIVAQETINICAVQGSVWPANPDDASYIEVVYSATQDC